MNRKEKISSERQLWSCIGAVAVGYSVVWRMPWLMNKHGGIGFFIPFFIVLKLVAYPILMVESAVGQYFRSVENDYFSPSQKYTNNTV